VISRQELSEAMTDGTVYLTCWMTTAQLEKMKAKRHLPFDPQYGSIIIGNVRGEFYVNTVSVAEAKGFRRVGYVLV